MEEFVIQHHRNAVQLAPVVRVDTAVFHGHTERERGGREEAGRVRSAVALPHLTQRLCNSRLVGQMALKWNHKETLQAAAAADCGRLVTLLEAHIKQRTCVFLLFIVV